MNRHKIPLHVAHAAHKTYTENDSLSLGEVAKEYGVSRRWLKDTFTSLGLAFRVADRAGFWKRSRAFAGQEASDAM